MQNAIALLNPQAAVRAIVATAMMSLFLGCASSRDVSNDPRYQIGFVPGQVYRLTRPATLYALNTDGASYLLDIDARASQHLAACGTLPARARLRISRLVQETIAAPIQGESYVTVYATLLDPRWRGHTVRIGWGLCRSSVFTAPDGWPTVFGSPDPAKFAIEP